MDELLPEGLEHALSLSLSVVSLSLSVVSLHEAMALWRLCDSVVAQSYFANQLSPRRANSRAARIRLFIVKKTFANGQNRSMNVR